MVIKRRDDDTAVVMSGSVESAKDPCPYRRRQLKQQDPTPAGEWVNGYQTRSGGFTLECYRPDQDKTTEWVHSTAVVNAGDWR